MKTWVHSLVQRISLASGRLPPVCHNYWSPSVLEPVLHKINPCNEKPTHCNWKIAPDQQNLRKLACKKERTASSWGEKKALSCTHFAPSLRLPCFSVNKPVWRPNEASALAVHSAYKVFSPEKCKTCSLTLFWFLFKYFYWQGSDQKWDHSRQCMETTVKDLGLECEG